MKNNNHQHYHRSDSLRVHVLRKTIPQFYFKHKSKLLKTVTRELAMKILNDFKVCRKIFKKKEKCSTKTKSPEKNQISKYKNLAIKFVNKISGNSPQKRIDSGERKTIIDEKAGTVAKLLYL